MTPTPQPTRRRALAMIAAALPVAACQRPMEPVASRALPAYRYSDIYAAASDGRFTLRALPYEEFDPTYLRQAVPNLLGQAPGSIIVNTAERLLYFGVDADHVLRFGVSVGREGFLWKGRARVGRKAAWPTWTPPAEMIKRQPELAVHRGGMAGGPQNPLGARSIYLYQNGRDTLYRIHGSPEFRSIGRAASSGCVRMLNQDVVYLYNRVAMGAPVLVE